MQYPAKFPQALCCLVGTVTSRFQLSVGPGLMGLCPHSSCTSGVTDLKVVTSAIPHAPGIPAWSLMLLQCVAFNGVPVLECLCCFCMLLRHIHFILGFLVALFFLL